LTDITNRWLDVTQARDTKEGRERNAPTTVGRIFQAISQNKAWQSILQRPTHRSVAKATRALAHRSTTSFGGWGPLDEKMIDARPGWTGLEAGVICPR